MQAWRENRRWQRIEERAADEAAEAAAERISGPNPGSPVADIVYLGTCTNTSQRS